MIESPNSAVRRVSGRVTNYKDTEMALRWTAAGFLDMGGHSTQARTASHLRRKKPMQTGATR